MAILRRFGLAAFVSIVATLGVGETAFADPAGPTDYESEILSIEPETESIEVAILGGDSFVQLIASPGTEVLVDGYRAEPYLWFRSDGTVLENRNSPTTYLNEERYGSDEPPAFATADAEPDWEQVASNGRYAWHDHRAHWMQPIRPAGKGPGDRIVEAVIPIVVDGGDVSITVASTWLPEPSPVPLGIGITAGLAAATVGGWLAMRRSRWTTVTVPLAVVAAGVGIVQFRSLPSETDPRLVWWALPVIAAVAAAVAVSLWARDRFIASAAALIAGVQLAIWGWIKRDGWTAAIIPTDAPGWLDRATVAAAIVGGTAITAIALWQLFFPPREPNQAG
ncbi:MAG: hypothetical protein ACE37B_21100 [Ilumatobacter sp.]|jgi:hypothetical protein|uniref:hypothetical protein n=1 Tax=Ilumatobacter sp. TaxID=1967498 RepID=UPI0039188B4B